MAFEPNIFDFGLNSSRGLIDGVQSVFRFGSNQDIDTGTTPEDVWGGGGIWIAPTAARVHDIVSTSIADTAVGTGARTVIIFGLTDWDIAESNEIITLNGTTPVPTANSYVIIHRMFVITGGSGETNAGDIVATAQTDATVTAVISAGKAQTLMAIYGIPSTQTLYVTSYATWLVETGGAANEILIQVRVQNNTDQPDSVFRTALETGLFSSGNSFTIQDANPPIALAGPAIIKITCFEVTSNNAYIAAAFTGYVIDNVVC